MIFSVIIPTFNRKEKLADCLEAVRSQTFDKKNYEVIVVDDGSTDGTWDYLKSLVWSDPRLIYFQQPNRGPAAARNMGATHSRGDYLAFTDDDCLVPYDWLAGLLESLAKWPQAGAVGGYLEAPSSMIKSNVFARLEFYETHRVYHASNQEYLGGFESPAGGTNNIVYRRNVFEELGGFDENFPVPAGEDADLKMRAVRSGYKIGYLPLKVTHLDAYSLSSYVRRSITHGFGAGFYEAKEGRASQLTPVVSVVFLPLIFIRTFRQYPDFGVAFFYSLKFLLMALGRFKYLRRKR